MKTEEVQAMGVSAQKLQSQSQARLSEESSHYAIDLQQVDLIYRRYPHPRDALLEWLLRTERHEKFYALRSVNFRLESGAALGVIGDNGAGKSTLLRMLAGNLMPTQGQCVVNGRRSALLELGSGLNPEFSGIENARVGLALRGLSQQEINNVLPEVLDFAELGEFAQQPVRNYSSGMVVRLVFAVATVIEPNVLIVDEALSVGDQYFQKKSLDRMREILTGGAALVFCSHNLYQLREICQQAIWLEQGQIRMAGEAQQVVDAYQDAVRARCAKGLQSVAVLARNAFAADGDTDKSTVHVNADVHLAQCNDVASGPIPRLLTVALQRDGVGQDTGNSLSELPCFMTGEPFTVQVKLNSADVAPCDLHVGVVIRRNDDIQCYGISTLHDGLVLLVGENSNAEVRFVIDSLPLLSGEYCLEVWLIDASGVHVYDARERCCHFRVQQVSQSQGVGMSCLPHRWEFGSVPDRKAGEGTDLVSGLGVASAEGDCNETAAA